MFRLQVIVAGAAMRIGTPHEPAAVKAAALRGRPLRADAQRNRARLLCAARAVFQRDGLSAQMDAIAAEAGLGVGTLYRHFPRREALIMVLVAEHLERLLAGAETAARTEDPWAAVEAVVWQLATFEAEDRGMLDVLTNDDTQTTAAGQSMAALMDYLGSVVARAQAAGVMRCDVSALDVMTAVCGVGKMMRPGTDDPERWRRLINVILDGLRTTSAHTA